MNELNVVTSDLRTHASNVHTAADRVEAAATAGGGVELGIETFGIIGGFFAGSARTAVRDTADQIHGIGLALHDIADAVSSTADAFDRTEDDNTVAFGGGPR